MILGTPPKSRKKLITLTPLIDVVFILLLFFMLSSTFVKWRSIDFIASQSNGASGNSSQSMLLRIHSDNNVDLSGHRTDLAGLGAALQAAQQDNRELNVLVDARDDVTLQFLIDVFDQLEQSGVSRFGMLSK